MDENFKDNFLGNNIVNSYRNKNKKSIKFFLFGLRYFFISHNTSFIILKIFIGFLLFGLPIFIFKQIINNNNSIEKGYEHSDYKSAGIPLIIAIITFISYVVLLIITQLCGACKNRFLFPPWDRNNMGLLITSLLVSCGLLFFVINLIESFEYIDTFREKLLEDIRSGDILTTTIAKILLYNVFDEKILSLNVTDLNLPSNLNDFDFDNISMINITNFQMKHINNNNSNSNQKFVFDTVRKDFVIFDILLKLCRPILFICAFFIIKMIFFATKNSFYFLVFCFAFIFEYFQIKINNGEENILGNFYEILPVYVFITFYLLFILENSYSFIVKFKHSSKNNLGRLEKYNCCQKIIVIFFDFLICVSLLLLLYSFTLSIDSKNSELFLNYSIKSAIKNIQQNNENLKKISLVGAILFIVGNFYKIGNISLRLAFYSIEKEFFPAPKKRFYFKVNEFNFKYVKKFHSEQLPTSFKEDFEENEVDQLLNKNS